jgi:hypothetical protein
MNISSIASATSAYASAGQSIKSQKAASLKPLQSALASGDLSAAQQAFSVYKKSLQSSPVTAATSTSGKTANTSSDDLQSLDSALQDGNLSAAKQAFNSLQRDVQNARQSRGGIDKTGNSAKAQVPESKHVKISVPANAVSQKTPSAIETLLDTQA